MSEQTAVNTTTPNTLVWDVCGHENIINYLKSIIVGNRLSHAYIFAGQKGLGKKNIVDKFIKVLYCRGQGDFRPCEECASCRQISAGSHPDVYRLQRINNAKTEKLYRDLTIGQIRDLKHILSQTTLLSGWKVAIIENAEDLNINSANSLLKVLEEPSAKTIIILITNDLSQLPKTVISRCQVLNFLPVARQKIRDYLDSFEGLSDKQKDFIAYVSFGRPQSARELAEDSAVLDDFIASWKSFYGFFGSSLASRLKVLTDIIPSGVEEARSVMRADLLFDWWLSALVPLLPGEESGVEILKFYDLHPPQLSDQDIAKVYQLIMNAKKKFDNNTTAKNILENLIINI